MPNGDERDNRLWDYVREVELRLMTISARSEAEIAAIKMQIAELNNKWTSFEARRSAIPTWIWIAITVAMGFLMWILDNIVAGP